MEHGSKIPQRKIWDSDSGADNDSNLPDMLLYDLVSNNWYFETCCIFLDDPERWMQQAPPKHW